MKIDKMEKDELTYHVPVLLKESVDGMNIHPDGTYVDVTFGGAGHSREILSRLGEGGRLLGFDQDEDAERNIVNDPHFIFVRSNFRYLQNFLRYHDIEQVDAILADLGVSSHHFDDSERGFSFRFDGALDMRMNKNAKISAYEVINEFSEQEIADILYKYGEEPKSRRIARKITEARKEKKIETTTELADIVIRAIGKSMKRHPAKRTFQAVRMYVNQELEVLEEALEKAVELLEDRGRLLVITFHSLEDRIVKNKFREFEKPCKCPPNIPICVCGKESLGKVITKKPIVAGELELNDNSRAHSAKLRVFERRA